MNEQERMYMEDVEEQKARRGYRTAELDSLQRHEMDRGSDLQHQPYRQRYVNHLGLGLESRLRDGSIDGADSWSPT